jgi:hypothetical protein
VVVPEFPSTIVTILLTSILFTGILVGQRLRRLYGHGI